METSNPADWVVPNIVDRRAKTDPESLYAQYPISSLTYDEGYRGITYRELANAVNCVANFLQAKLGPGNCEILPYIGPNDLRYPALIIGAVKAGYAIFTTSPRNSVTAQVKLLERLRCRVILSPRPRLPQIEAMADATGLPVIEVPTVMEMLDGKYPHVPFKPFQDSVLEEPFFVIHTSGSTGFPKPLTYTHRSALRSITHYAAKPDAGVPTLNTVLLNKRVWFSFPPFHGAYLSTHLCNAIPFGFVPVSPISGAIPSAAGVVEGLKKCPADVAVLVPSIVSELAEAPELLDYCAKHLEMIFYCGGDLPQAIGDVIAAKVRLANLYGASEIGIPSQLWSPNHFDTSDWKYVHYHPNIGYEMREAENGTYELVMVRNEAKIQSQLSFTLFPQAREYATRDLFVRHHSKPDFWKWVARRDDIVVFLNGEKTNPISMEQHVMQSNPRVRSALVAGAQRFEAALIIEPASDDDLSASQRAAFIEELWPIVEEANQECPAHARISKSHILFTKPGKPMARTGKGTIQRFATYTLYSEELDSLYKDAEAVDATDGGSNDNARLATLKDVGAAKAFVREAVLEVTGRNELDDEDNFFTIGIDSLQAIKLTRNLRRAFAIPSISLSVVYTNPSVTALSKAIFQISSNKLHPDKAEYEERLETRHQILSDYRTRISQIHPRSSNPTSKSAKQTVVLTGSTGTLGSHILDVLLGLTNVAHVYCLNRRSNGEGIQAMRNATQGIVTSYSPEKVTFLTADLSKPHFNLPPSTYSTLLENTTSIIHNAWPVNFNLSLRSFSPQLEGVANLISFTATAPHSPHLFFVSSISSVVSCRKSPIPEHVIETDLPPGVNGYAESKYISEVLLSHAASALNIQTSFARVGQVAGSTVHPGIWNKAEWFPSLILSSLAVGAIPDSLGPSLGRVDWIPVDKLAQVLCEMTLVDAPYREAKSVGVFHALNPKPVSWFETLRTVTQEIHLRTGQTLEVVGLKEWIEAVKAHGKKTLGEDVKLEDGELEEYLERNPALKLMDFYEHVLATGQDKGEGRDWEFAKSLEASGALRELQVIKGKWVGKWVDEWISSTKGE